jgi:hypothetical protein
MAVAAPAARDRSPGEDRFGPMPSPVVLPGLSRRTFLAGAAGAAVLAACGGDDASPAADGGGGDGPANLLALFAPQGVLISGAEQRTTFAIADAEGVPVQDLPPEQEFSVIQGGEELEVVTAVAQTEGIPTPYYPVLFTPPGPGDYEITTTFEGAELTPRAFVVSAPEEVSIPQPGEPMIPVDTPTTTDSRGVDPICTLEPPCPLHEVTLTEALGEGRPVAFLIATPEFCQTALCGPVLDVLLAEVDTHPDVRFLHAEVYGDPRAVDNITEATVAEAPQAYALPFEPALFLADRDTTISTRLDNLYGAEELRAGLARLT